MKGGEDTLNVATPLVLPTPEVQEEHKLEVSPSEEGFIHIS